MKNLLEKSIILLRMLVDGYPQKGHHGMGLHKRPTVGSGAVAAGTYAGGNSWPQNPLKQDAYPSNTKMPSSLNELQFVSHVGVDENFGKRLYKDEQGNMYLVHAIAFAKDKPLAAETIISDHATNKMYEALLSQKNNSSISIAQSAIIDHEGLPCRISQYVQPSEYSEKNTNAILSAQSQLYSIDALLGNAFDENRVISVNKNGSVVISAATDSRWSRSLFAKDAKEDAEIAKNFGNSDYTNNIFDGKTLNSFALNAMYAPSKFFGKENAEIINPISFERSLLKLKSLDVNDDSNFSLHYGQTKVPPEFRTTVQEWKNAIPNNGNFLPRLGNGVDELFEAKTLSKMQNKDVVSNIISTHILAKQSRDQVIDSIRTSVKDEVLAEQMIAKYDKRLESLGKLSSVATQMRNDNIEISDDYIVKFGQIHQAIISDKIPERFFKYNETIKPSELEISKATIHSGGLTLFDISDDKNKSVLDSITSATNGVGANLQLIPKTITTKTEFDTYAKELFLSRLRQPPTPTSDPNSIFNPVSLRAKDFLTKTIASSGLSSVNDFIGVRDWAEAQSASSMSGLSNAIKIGFVEKVFGKSKSEDGSPTWGSSTRSTWKWDATKKQPVGVFLDKERFQNSDELLRDQIAAGRIKIQDFGQYNSDGSISKITDPKLTARMSALQGEFARNNIGGNWNRFLEELDSDISHQQRKLATYQSPRMNESQKSKLQTEIDQGIAFLEKNKSSSPAKLSDSVSEKVTDLLQQARDTIKSNSSPEYKQSILQLENDVINHMNSIKLQTAQIETLIKEGLEADSTHLRNSLAADFPTKPSTLEEYQKHFFSSSVRDHEKNISKITEKLSDSDLRRSMDKLSELTGVPKLKYDEIIGSSSMKYIIDAHVESAFDGNKRLTEKQFMMEYDAIKGDKEQLSKFTSLLEQTKNYKDNPELYLEKRVQKLEGIKDELLTEAKKFPLLASPGGSLGNAMTAQHAFTYTILDSIPLPLHDQKSKTALIFRTDSLSRFPDFKTNVEYFLDPNSDPKNPTVKFRPTSADDESSAKNNFRVLTELVDPSDPSKGLNGTSGVSASITSGTELFIPRNITESFSAFSGVSIGNPVYSAQEVPFHRIIGSFLDTKPADKNPNDGTGLFATRVEMEYLVAPVGLKSTVIGVDPFPTGIILSNVIVDGTKMQLKTDPESNKTAINNNITKFSKQWADEKGTPWYDDFITGTTIPEKPFFKDS